ncbi:hypothetical protein ACG9ZJ_21420, partial [Acinetobacter sp. ULE_I064]|uniref:hypothetical protein n=1 Tax=Acinetobacter sp. ULE_I064 TaxID=3373071 RepID=UPI003AF411D9
AYYNPNDKSVIIAHRGSATLTDWLKHNPKIAMEVIGKPRETMADVAGKRFTNSMLEMLDRQGNEIGLVIHTGHSLGGRVSQHSLIEVVENLKLDSKGVTFNSAPIKNPTGNVYEHVNLQLSGGNMLNTDIVSAFGKQLGENYKVVSKEINNPISAHLLSNFKHIQNENPAFVKDDLSKVLNHIKQGKDYFEYQAEANNEKSRTVYSIPNLPNQKENTMSNDQKAYFSSEITPQLNKMNFKTDKVEATLSGQSVSANLKSNDPTDKANYQAILNENKKGEKELSIIKTERNAENVNISVHQFSQKEIESRKVNLNEKAYSVSHERMGDKTQYHTNDQKSAKELANDIKVNERGTVSFKDNLGKENQPTATIYHGQNSKMVAQLETNSSNANGKSIEHVNNDSKKLEELQDQKKSFNQSVESLKKADLKEFQDLKEKGYKIEVHDLSNQKGKSVQEEKSNIEELKKIADSYKQAEVPRAGKSYSGVILAQGEDTTIQKTPTGKFIVHETENLQQMKVSDTHRNQSIKYVTDKQTDVKSIGYDELKKSQTQEAKQPEQSKSNSNSFER